MSERERLKASLNNTLRLMVQMGASLPVLLDVMREVVNERESEDAARYRWLKESAPSHLAAIAWRVPAACRYDEADIDKVIDVARGVRKT
jgi:hypothetical protein